MLYIKFQVREKKTESDTRNSFLMKVLFKILDWVVPKANPTLEGNIDNVFVWYVEYDISGSYTNRESFNPVSVSAKEFETLWDKPFIV